MKKLFAASLFVAAVLCGTAAFATTITLATPPTIVAGSPGIAVDTPAVQATTTPSVWVAGTWWSPSANQCYNGLTFCGGDLPGDYVYRIAFDLTGFDYTTATLSGTFSTDDVGFVKLNSTVGAANLPPNPYASVMPYSFSGGAFVAGINYLYISVNNGTGAGGPIGPNGENPTGVLYTGTVEANVSTQAAVPEPATLTLLGLGLAGIAATIRRRRA